MAGALFDAHVLRAASVDFGEPAGRAGAGAVHLRKAATEHRVTDAHATLVELAVCFGERVCDAKLGSGVTGNPATLRLITSRERYCFRRAFGGRRRTGSWRQYGLRALRAAAATDDCQQEKGQRPDFLSHDSAHRVQSRDHSCEWFRFSFSLCCWFGAAQNRHGLQKLRLSDDGWSG